MNQQELFNLDSQYVMQTYGRNPVAIKGGKGATLWDFDGNEYIDFTSGIGVNSVGYGNEKWLAAITDQAATLQHISNTFYSQPYIMLAKALCQRTGMSKVFFSNSGAEANEGIIKLARKYSFDKYSKGRSTVITLVNSFHGRTITTLNATGQDVFHNYFFPFTEGFRYAQANSFDSLMEVTGTDVCAVMMELVQGEGGVLPLDKEYVQAVAKYCAENDILLLIDEVQTGVGRTGTLFAYQQFDIQPDAVSFAKGIAGGLPMGGFMAAEKTQSVLTPGTHATTFGGNPVCCSAALTVLDILDDQTIAQVKEKGQYIRDKIAAMDLPMVKGVRGMGLMLGVVLDGLDNKATAAKLDAAGLLCLTAGKEALRFLPPLTITYDEIDRGLAIFEKEMTK